MPPKFKPKEFDEPNIILALDWFDERIYRGIVRYAKQAGWHLSPYLISGRFIPYGWPADGAITCYGNTLEDFIDSLDMPQVDISFADFAATGSPGAGL
jgi:LacI family transcriptional regulator